MTSHNQRFDQRISNTPLEWQQPLADVIDTADAIRLALLDWEIDSPELLLGLTKLALDRHDAAHSSSSRKG